MSSVTVQFENKVCSDTEGKALALPFALAALLIETYPELKPQLIEKTNSFKLHFCNVGTNVEDALSSMYNEIKHYDV